MQIVARSSVLRIAASAGVAVAAALALRYLYLDSDTVRVACDARPDTLSCTVRAKLALYLRLPSLGWGILAIALVAALRPATILWMIAASIVAAGMVLYQADLASGSAALLLLGLALTRRSAQ